MSSACSLRSRLHTDRRRFVWSFGAFAALVLLVVGHLSSGGLLLDIKTASMGTAAPVGTMVVTRPVQPSDVVVGDIVAFSDATGRTVTHRVVETTPNGLITRGDANSVNDPAVLSAELVKGKVVARFWRLGWVLRVAPWLLIGFFIVWLLVERLAIFQHWLPWKVLGGCVVFSVSAFILNPWFRADAVNAGPCDRKACVTAVATGVFPMRVSATHGTSIVLKPGERGTVEAPVRFDQRGALRAATVRFTPALAMWLRLLIAVSPALLLFLVGLPGHAPLHGPSRLTDDNEGGPLEIGYERGSRRLARR